MGFERGILRGSPDIFLNCSFALILMVSGIHVERSLSCADDVEDYNVV